jgi:hypothetical protein
MRDRLPTGQEIAIDVSKIADFTPIAELAKVACIVDEVPPRSGIVFGVYLTNWQKKIFSAQIASLLGMSL